jgi:hypothetical protein
LWFVGSSASFKYGLPIHLNNKVLDGFVVLAALILNPRAKQRRQRETPRSMEEAAETDMADATARSSTTAGNHVVTPCPSPKIEGHIETQLEGKL